MNDSFNNKLFSERFRIKTSRLQKWDYSSTGYYFITICINNKKPYFGNIKNGKMILSDIGKIADQYWREIPIHFPHVILDEFVVMPNHVHGIIQIIEKFHPIIIDFSDMCNDNNIVGTLQCGDAIETLQCGDAIETLQCNVSTKNNIAKNNIRKNMSEISPKSGSIPIIVRSYKSITAREIRKLPNPFIFNWQSRYYDRISHNERSLNIIRQYIKNNPKKWHRDRNNK